MPKVRILCWLRWPGVLLPLLALLTLLYVGLVLLPFVIPVRVAFDPGPSAEEVERISEDLERSQPGWSDYRLPLSKESLMARIKCPGWYENSVFIRRANENDRPARRNPAGRDTQWLYRIERRRRVTSAAHTEGDIDSAILFPVVSQNCRRIRSENGGEPSGQGLKRP